MPDVPQVKTFPYTTEKRCPVCHPADQDEPPFLVCLGERDYGESLERQLRCDNCNHSEQDVFNKRLARVTYDYKEARRITKF